MLTNFGLVVEVEKCTLIFAIFGAAVDVEKRRAIVSGEAED
jgi:hypothetical protein